MKPASPSSGTTAQAVQAQIPEPLLNDLYYGVSPTPLTWDTTSPADQHCHSGKQRMGVGEKENQLEAAGRWHT